MDVYFVICVFVFGYIVVSLFVAVIVSTFQKIRILRDKEEREALAAAGFAVDAKGNMRKMDGSKTGGGTDDKSRGREELEALLSKIFMEHYTPNILLMVDNTKELLLLTEQDMVTGGVKLMHARQIFEEAQNQKALVPFGQKEDLPVAAAEILTFLRGIDLEKYYPAIVLMCDGMADVSVMTYDDCIAAGMKVTHARRMVEKIENYRLRNLQKGDPIGSNPILFEINGGESVAIWRASLLLGSSCLPPWFWQSSPGKILMDVWYHADPMVDSENPPPPAARDRFLEPYPRFDTPVGHVIASDGFDMFISGTIVANIIFMAMEHEDQSDLLTSVCTATNIIFSAVFVIEMCLKWKGLGGLKYYFENPYNVVDFFIVLSSLPDFLTLALNIKGANLSPLRACRLFRLLRLLRQMRQLIDVIMSSAKAISNLVVFIMASLIIFGILGVQLFAGRVFDGDGELPRANFDTFPEALLALFQVMTGEDWNAMMYNVMRDQTYMGAGFFIVFFVFANFILMEMFVAVILENFRLQHDEKVMLQESLFAAKLAQRQSAAVVKNAMDLELKELQAKQYEQDEAKRDRQMAEKMRAKADGVPLENELTPEQRAKQAEKRQKDLDAAREEMLAAQEAKLREQQAAAVSNVDTVHDEYLSNQLEYEQGQQDEQGALTDPNAPRQRAKGEAALVEKSCYAFTQDSEIRKWCVAVATNVYFDNFIFLCIIASSITLAMQNTYQPDDATMAIIGVLDIIFMLVFLFECIIKIISNGFYGAPTAYMAESWNR